MSKLHIRKASTSGRRICALLVALAALLAVGASPAAAQVTEPTPCPFGELTLSGSTDPEMSFGVDDDVEVRLNEATIYEDDNGVAPPENGPLHFSAEGGDELRVIASNGIFAGPASIEPLYLHCDATGEYQVLDADGFTDSCDPCPANEEVFYDQTFTIQFLVPQCSDRADNDGDSRTDHPADPGCESRTDNSEADPVVSQPSAPPPAGDSTSPEVRVAGVRQGCVRRDFRLRVRVTENAIALTTVSLDRRRIAKSRNASFSVIVRASRLRAGAHRLRIASVDETGNRRTVRRSFTRCARRAQRPRLTG